MRVNLQCALSIAVLAGLAGAALRATYAGDRPGPDEVWSTKKVMDKCFLGKQSLVAVVNKDLQRTEPDWKSDEVNLTEIIRLMSMLTRQKPLRGSQEAWDELVQDYVRKAKAAQQNIKECKLQLARGSLVLVLSTCDNCHDTHGIK